jgi:hypothetical protein
MYAPVDGNKVVLNWRKTWKIIPVFPISNFPPPSPGIHSSMPRVPNVSRQLQMNYDFYECEIFQADF